jgi:hypothetical protein
MPNRRRGHFQPRSPEVRAEHEAEGVDLAPVTYQLTPEPDDAFDRPALATVRDLLSTNPRAPRFE